MEDKVNVLREKYQKVLRGNELPILVSYKGNLWEGIEDRNGEIHAVNLTGIVRSEIGIGKNQMKVVMSRRSYEILVSNTRGGLSESVGVLFGRRAGEEFIVDYVININLPGTKGLKAVGVSAGKLAHEDVDRLIASRESGLGHKAIGFYHSHPTRDTFSPSDFKEFAKLRSFPHLREPSYLHILCRRTGLAPVKSISRFALLPKAFFISSSIGMFHGYREIPVIIHTR